MTDGEKEKYKAVLNVSYMSEDDGMTDEEGWHHLKLTWRADDITKFFRELDQRSKTNKNICPKERLLVCQLSVLLKTFYDG